MDKTQCTDHVSLIELYKLIFHNCSLGYPLPCARRVVNQGNNLIPYGHAFLFTAHRSRAFSFHYGRVCLVSYILEMAEG